MCKEGVGEWKKLQCEKLSNKRGGYAVNREEKRCSRREEKRKEKRRNCRATDLQKLFESRETNPAGGLHPHSPLIG